MCRNRLCEYVIFFPPRTLAKCYVSPKPIYIITLMQSIKSIHLISDMQLCIQQQIRCHKHKRMGVPLPPCSVLYMTKKPLNTSKFTFRINHSPSRTARGSRGLGLPRRLVLKLPLRIITPLASLSTPWPCLDPKARTI